MWCPQSAGRPRPRDKLGQGKGAEATTALSQCPQNIQQGCVQEARVRVKNGLPAIDSVHEAQLGNGQMVSQVKALAA